MTCETARDRLLEGDLSELRGEGDGDLAGHLRACPACQALARQILDQTAALAAGLNRVRPRTAARERRRLPHRGRGTSLRRWAVAIPLALAASLAVLLLSRDRMAPAPVTGVTSAVGLGSAPLDVQVPPGRTVSVFHTDNPNIVVIWSF